MVVDFISTYPSIICWSACISSPESVYYESDGNNVFSGIYNLSCITYYYIPLDGLFYTSSVIYTEDYETSDDHASLSIMA